MLIRVNNKDKTKYDQRVFTDRAVRRHLDQIHGVTRGKGPQRGDYKLCRECDKVLADYRKYKGKADREKIKGEYYQAQEEHREYNPDKVPFKEVL